MSLERQEEWERYAEHFCGVVRRQVQCSFCDGDGEIEVPCPVQAGRYVWMECEACGGSGLIDDREQHG